jgi:hypothetical protein
MLPGLDIMIKSMVGRKIIFHCSAKKLMLHNQNLRGAAGDDEITNFQHQAIIEGFFW